MTVKEFYKKLGELLETKDENGFIVGDKSIIKYEYDGPETYTFIEFDTINLDNGDVILQNSGN